MSSNTRIVVALLLWVVPLGAWAQGEPPPEEPMEPSSAEEPASEERLIGLFDGLGRDLGDAADCAQVAQRMNAFLDAQGEGFPVLLLDVDRAIDKMSAEQRGAYEARLVPTLDPLFASMRACEDDTAAQEAFAAFEAVVVVPEAAPAEEEKPAETALVRFEVASDFPPEWSICMVPVDGSEPELCPSNEGYVALELTPGTWRLLSTPPGAAEATGQVEVSFVANATFVVRLGLTPGEPDEAGEPGPPQLRLEIEEEREVEVPPEDAPAETPPGEGADG